MPHICPVYKTVISKQLVKSQDISEKQAYALGIVSVLIKRNPDLPPTLSEIAKYLDMTKQAVGRLLMVLERKGYVLRSSAHRSIRLTGKPLPYANQKGRAA